MVQALQRTKKETDQMKPDNKDFVRFHNNYKIMPSGCWEWQRCLNDTGYGRFGFKHQTIASHRFSATYLAGLTLNTGDCVCHRCDNPACVNPDHLFVGSHSDNMRDMTAKGRNRYPNNKGMNHGASKLTDIQVKDIRLRVEHDRNYVGPKSGIQKRLSIEYSVSEDYVRRIVKRKVWTHI
jgi:hypothetical protein